MEITECLVPEIFSEELEKRLEEEISKLHYVAAEKFDEEEAEEGDSKLTADHVKVLEDFARRWFVSLEDRCKKLGNIHPEYFGRMVKDLQEWVLLGKLESFGVSKGKPRKSALVTEEGAKYLQIPYKKCIPPGKGGLLHRFIQSYLKNVLPYSTIEFQSGDLVQYQPEGRKIVYEIELNPLDDHFLKNIRVDLSIFDEIVVVARTPADKKSLKEKATQVLEPEIFEVVKFKTVKEVYDESTAPF